MMQRHMERLRRAVWNFKQPLTLTPKLGVPISDLFVWRNSAEWETFFELTDIPGLFADRAMPADRYVTLVFFDHRGTLFLEKRLDSGLHRRHTLELSQFISGAESAFGTFCVFHSHIPQAVTDLGSYVAERGYVSYRYLGAPLRAYVHGNLDAIALLPSQGLQLLGAHSFLTREYRLQHELRGPALYEIAVVNPSKRDQRISCRVLSLSSGEVLETQEIQLKPKGCHAFPVNVDPSQPVRVVMNSHLVMARPLVFRIHGQKMDVFHG
jgi:hypothetical protein